MTFHFLLLNLELVILNFIVKSLLYFMPFKYEEYQFNFNLYFSLILKKEIDLVEEIWFNFNFCLMVWICFVLIAIQMKLRWSKLVNLLVRN